VTDEVVAKYIELQGAEPPDDESFQQRIACIVRLAL
jgi:hypothetical protein